MYVLSEKKLNSVKLRFVAACVGLWIQPIDNLHVIVGHDCMIANFSVFSPVSCKSSRKEGLLIFFISHIFVFRSLKVHIPQSS